MTHVGDEILHGRQSVALNKILTPYRLISIWGNGIWISPGYCRLTYSAIEGHWYTIPVELLHCILF
jgi:hypothetical protein